MHPNRITDILVVYYHRQNDDVQKMRRSLSGKVDSSRWSLSIGHLLWTVLQTYILEIKIDKRECKARLNVKIRTLYKYFIL